MGLTLEGVGSGRIPVAPCSGQTAGYVGLKACRENGEKAILKFDSTTIQFPRLILSVALAPP